jgi:hypothetical protein
LKHYVTARGVLVAVQAPTQAGAALTSRLQSFETDLLTQEENLTGLAALNRELIAKAETIDSPQRVVLDMDSTEIPVYGQQENSAYNGYFESTCYHPLSGFLRTRRSQNWPLPGPLKSLGTKNMRKAALMEAVGCTIVRGQEAKTEILVKPRHRRTLFVCDTLSGSNAQVGFADDVVAG